MIEKSEDIKAISVALLKAQKEIGAALKNAKNPYFKSNYADMKAVIEAIKEPLNKNGITFLQAVNGAGEGMPVVETMLLHESGQYLCSKAPVYCQKPNDPQAFGTGITYTKRYTLQAFLGLPTEDDDGNAASTKKGKNGNEKPIDKTLDIVEQAFFNFTTENKDDLVDGFIFDKDKFIKAIVKHFKQLPTLEESIPLILKTVKPVEVLAEVKVPKPKGKQDANTPS